MNPHAENVVLLLSDSMLCRLLGKITGVNLVGIHERGVKDLDTEAMLPRQGHEGVRCASKYSEGLHRSMRVKNH